MSAPVVSRAQTASSAVPAGIVGCVVCKRSDKLLRCSRCKIAVYCTKEHQRLDWKRHKAFCQKHPPHLSVTVEPSYETTPGSDNFLENTVDRSSFDAISNLRGILSTNSQLLASSETSQKDSVNDSYLKGNSSMSGEFLRNYEYTEKSVDENRRHPRGARADGWTSPITYEGSSEDTILGARAESLNPALETSAILSTAQHSALEMPTHHHNGINNFPEIQLNREEDFLPPFLHRNRNNLDERIIDQICRNVITDMDQYGVCVVDTFLGAEKGMAVLNEVLNMYSAGLFKDGQLVSNKAGASDLKTIRGDQITWLDGKEKQCQNIGMLISQVDAIIMRANKMYNNGRIGNYTINGRTKFFSCYDSLVYSRQTHHRQCQCFALLRDDFLRRGTSNKKLTTPPTTSFYRYNLSC
ncbi:uncharacterized protein LOC107274942 isoform X2 [Cephus cinctus]|uniref:Uncharacterized protein LOC107274942 isoform X2 n=1 Tax=Cephus cinctus TaxID=211228 RepID=A0AAJ7VY60_CEPCN|nr:uncharacterized protein LOC107274942 isoform X2 [Cephus cinctus]